MRQKLELSSNLNSKSQKPLKVDLHIHTAEDPRHQINYTAKDLIAIAADEGYDVLAITNHQCLTFSKKLSAYAMERGILLIPGIEVTIRRRHVVLLNPPSGKSFPDFPSLLAMQRPDAFVMAPHPYFPNPYSLNGVLVKHLKYFDAIEYCHFYSPAINFNHMALRVSETYGVPLVGNSDAHFLSQLGTTYSLIHAEKDPESIFEAIREGCSQVVSRPLSPLEMGAILGRFAGMKFLVEKNKRQKWLASRLRGRGLKLPLSSSSRSQAS
jgi:predicted metal-dependent phosphoesterase TrpH